MYAKSVPLNLPQKEGFGDNPPPSPSSDRLGLNDHLT